LVRRRKGSARTKASKMPEILYAQVSPKSIGKTSLFDFQKLVTSENVTNFYSDPDVIRNAAETLRIEGFTVYETGRITLTMAGPPKLYQKVFKTKLIAEERPVIKEMAREDTATFIDSEETEISGLIDTSNSVVSDLVEGIAINEPVYYFATPSFFPPPKSYWHLDVPADVSLGLNADRAHRFGFTGRKIKVTMVDSGHYLHPFFSSRGYRVHPTVLGPGTSNPNHDELGHGTGESANIFSSAPDVEFTMVKMSFVDSVGAFNTGVGLKPDIISCSWGSDICRGPLSAANQTLAAAVANAVSQRITVVFSAGNGQWSFPGQHPDVISAGGVYMKPDGSFEATPYASGFSSNIYSGRIVPDVCGLVGLPPGAQYIMLPVEPGDTLDTNLAGGTHPNGDETAPDDGWAAFSGTSAAAPQLAGICALMKEACDKLSPSRIRDILKRTARDVVAGTAAIRTGGVCPGEPGFPPPSGHPAVPGPDLATGNGLADAFRATALARASCVEDMESFEDMMLEFMG
jgi:hypothetical protein